VAGGDLSVANDREIHDRLSRVEEIIEQLNADEYDLDEGTGVHEEGQELLAEVREILDNRRGDVVELE
jgi:exodeoxyribonuclease VII small subunit